MIHVYGKPDCIRCENIKERFDAVGIKYKYHDLAHVMKTRDHKPSRVDVMAITAYREKDVKQVPFGIVGDEVFGYVELNKMVKEEKRSK